MSFIIIGAPGTRVALMKMNQVYCGCPFVQLMAHDSIDLKRLDLTYCGAPFVAYSKG